ncbi:ZBT11 protein, partial [Polyodon spathula]|nr:ZBT11 protein [Polyodon spathula]
MAGDCAYNKHHTKEATSFSNKHLLDCKREAGGDAAIDSVGEKSLTSPFYEVIDGILYRRKLEKGYINYREVLDADRRLGAIATFHQKRNGALHHTLEDTYRFVAENYWWEGMFFPIRDYVLGCKECTARRMGMHVYEETITKTLVSHGTDVLKNLNSQRDEGLFCDITLIVDGATYSAHKAVLAAVSEYFKEMFTEMDSTSNHKSAVDLTGFSPDSFLPLLEFSYTSTLSFKLENLTEICAMARHFRMWSVVELCKGIQKEQVDTLQRDGLLDKQTFSTPMKRLKLLDFKSPSKKRKSSPKNLCTKISPSRQNPNWAMTSPTKDKKEISLQGITTTPIQANYKKQLSFSLPDECTKERLEICTETFKSPVKTEPVEEEVQSPNTVEKYKLLRVLGLQRKSLIVCGEELTGWRQKKRLRKLKACSYSLTTRRKRSMGNLNSREHSDDKQSLPEGKINQGIIKAEKTESEISPVQRHKVMLRRRGYGWTTRSKVASVKLRVAAEQKTLQAIHDPTEKTTVGCNRGRSSRLESRQLPSVRPENVQISKHIKKEMPAKQSVFTANNVRSRRLGLLHTNKPSFLSVQVDNPLAEERSVEDLSKGSTNKNIRLLRSIRQTVKINDKYVCVGKKAALVGARQKLNSQPFQKAPSKSSFFCNKEVGKTVKQTKSGNADARNQRFRPSTCKVQLSSGLGKRKRKPSQKLLDAGFLFNLHRPKSTKEVAGSSSTKKDSKKHELCLTTTTSVSKLSSKKIRGSGPQTSEILGRTRGAIKNAEAVLVLGRKLLKVKGNRPLVKRKESYWSAEGRSGKCDIDRTTSRKRANVQLLADLGSTFDCTDGLPKIVDMKTRLPKFAEVIKRTRVKRLKARVSTNSSCSSIAVSSHTCSECKDSFKNCDSLIMHKIRHIEGKHWPCPLCQKTFFRQKNVQNHIRTHDQMLYRCKHCMK